MEILKIAIEWTKAEVFSKRFFIFFAIVFLIASIEAYHKELKLVDMKNETKK